MYNKISKKNVTIVPYIFKNNRFTGGVNEPPDISRIERRGKTYLDVWDDDGSYLKTQKKYFKGNFLYAGPLFPHYGHVMTESIHRLYAYNKKEHDGIIFTACWFSSNGVDKINLPSYLLRVLSLFSIDPEICYIVKEHCDFESVDFYQPGSALQVGPTETYLEFLDSKIELQRPPSNESWDKIFLGRTHIIEQGTVMGESYISNKLFDCGYRYLAPEQFDLNQQIAILKSAKEIVFVEGSSIYASELLGKWEANIYMLPRRNYDTYFRPHLASKTNYFTLGDINSLVRLNNTQGKVKPNSPTIYKSPETIHFDLVEHGIIKDSKFNISTYEKHEELDLITYTHGDKNILSDYKEIIKGRH